MSEIYVIKGLDPADYFGRFKADKIEKPTPMEACPFDIENTVKLTGHFPGVEESTSLIIPKENIIYKYIYPDDNEE